MRGGWLRRRAGGITHGLGIAIVLSMAIAASGCGGDDGPSTLSVTGAWARPTPASADNAVVYLSIVSPIDDEIIAVSVPASIAAEAQLHESMEAGGSGAHQHGATSGGVASDSTSPGSGTGVMVMEPLASVPLRAKTAVQFEPGGKHIMLVGLTGPLVRGQQFELTVTMKTAPPLVVSVPVQDNAP